MQTLSGNEDKIRTLKMSSCSYYVELRLKEWGAWARNDGLGHLLSKSNIAQIMACGGVFVQSSQKKESDSTNPEIVELEKLISALAASRPLESQALHDYYVSADGKKSIAARRKIAVRTLEDRLKCAKLWLEGRLSAKFC